MRTLWRFLGVMGGIIIIVVECAGIGLIVCLTALALTELVTLAQRLAGWAGIVGVATAVVILLFNAYEGINNLVKEKKHGPR